MSSVTDGNHGEEYSPKYTLVLITSRLMMVSKIHPQNHNSRHSKVQFIYTEPIEYDVLLSRSAHPIKVR